MNEITLLDALERATSENITVAFKKYGFGINMIIITDMASGKVWRKRYKWGSELIAWSEGQ